MTIVMTQTPSSTAVATDADCDGKITIDEVGWYREDSGMKTNAVCQKKTNSLGLCDMSGNVSEWVWDSFSWSVGTEDSEATTQRPYRVLRGGGWGIEATKVVELIPLWQDAKMPNIGFRLVRNSD